MKNGGSILIQSGEGGEKRFKTNLNVFLDQFGISINNDSVIRTILYKCFHPKEVWIQNGILNRSINNAAGKKIPGTNSNGVAGSTGKTGESAVNLDKKRKSRASNGNSVVGLVGNAEEEEESKGIEFVYPYGATLMTEKPAIPIMSSGYISYPLNRPIGAVVDHLKGRMVVIGSVHIFDDKYLEMEENSTLQEILFDWLLRNEGAFELNQIDATTPDITDYQFLADTKSLSKRVKSCLQESEELPKDWTSLFQSNLFKFETDNIIESIELHRKMGVKHEGLTLIPPAFETPFPPLQPAVYPPSLRELPSPSLELFDLDEQFASEEIRLAHLTNRLNNEDIPFYIKRAAEILGITTKMKSDLRQSPKHILEFIFRQIVHFKKSSQT